MIAITSVDFQTPEEGQLYLLQAASYEGGGVQAQARNSFYISYVGPQAATWHCKMQYTNPAFSSEAAHETNQDPAVPSCGRR